MAWGQFLYFLVVDVEHGLYGGPFGGDYGDLVVLVVVSGAYPVGVAHNKGVPMADEAAHDIPAVEFFTGAGQEALHVEVVVDQIVYFDIGVPFRFEPGVEALYFIV